MKTVISHEHDHGIVSQARLLNGRQHPAHLVIHEADGGIVSSPQFSLLEQKGLRNVKYICEYLHRDLTLLSG